MITVGHRKIWINTDRASRVLECSWSSVWRLIECGAIDGYRRTAKGWYRIDLDSVQAYKNWLENGGSIEDWLELRRREKEVAK